MGRYIFLVSADLHSEIRLERGRRKWPRIKPPTSCRHSRPGQCVTAGSVSCHKGGSRCCRRQLPKESRPAGRTHQGPNGSSLASAPHIRGLTDKHSVHSFIRQTCAFPIWHWGNPEMREAQSVSTLEKAISRLWIWINDYGPWASVNRSSTASLWRSASGSIWRKEHTHSVLSRLKPHENERKRQVSTSGQNGVAGTWFILPPKTADNRQNTENDGAEDAEHKPAKASGPWEQRSKWGDPGVPSPSWREVAGPGVERAPREPAGGAPRPGGWAEWGRGPGPGRAGESPGEDGGSRTRENPGFLSQNVARLGLYSMQLLFCWLVSFS